MGLLCCVSEAKNVFGGFGIHVLTMELKSVEGWKAKVSYMYMTFWAKISKNRPKLAQFLQALLHQPRYVQAT